MLIRTLFTVQIVQKMRTLKMKIVKDNPCIIPVTQEIIDECKITGIRTIHYMGDHPRENPRTEVL